MTLYLWVFNSTRDRVSAKSLVINSITLPNKTED